MYGREVRPLSHKMNDIYQKLNEEGAALYRGIGICALDELKIDVATVILDSTEEKALEAITKLVDANLLEYNKDSAHRLLPVVTAHACGVAKTHDSAETQVELVTRVGEALLFWLREANAALGRTLPPYSAGYQPTYHHQGALSNPESAVKWMTEIQKTALAVAEVLISRANNPELADKLASALWLLVVYRKDSDFIKRIESIRSLAATSSANPRALRLIARRRGMAALKAGNYAKAENNFTRFAELSRQADDSLAIEDQLDSMICFGLMLHAQGGVNNDSVKLAKALEYFDNAVNGYAVAHKVNKEGVARDYRAQIYLVINQPHKALHDATHAQQLFEENSKDIYSLARARITQGEAYLALGDHTTARKLLEEAAGKLTELGAVDELARTYRALGQCATAAGDYRVAAEYLRDAHELLAREDSYSWSLNASA